MRLLKPGGLLPERMGGLARAVGLRPGGAVQALDEDGILGREHGEVVRRHDQGRTGTCWLQRRSLWGPLSMQQEKRAQGQSGSGALAQMRETM